MDDVLNTPPRNVDDRPWRLRARIWPASLLPAVILSLMLMLERCVQACCSGLPYSLSISWWAFRISAASGVVAAFSPQRPAWSHRWRPLLTWVHLSSSTTSVVGILAWGTETADP